MSKLGTDQIVDITTVKNKDKNAFLPIHKQEVRDERGRKRLHGAFQGGFSAGFFNTVGSKEGWAPKVLDDSSSSKYAQKKEDFMDEEDLSYSQQHNLELKDSFQSSSKIEKDQFQIQKTKLNIVKDTKNSSNVLQNSKLSDLLIGPPSDSIGAILIKKMGWRPGQGIGPKRKRLLKETKDDIHAAEMLFAPKLNPNSIHSFTAKRNTYGVGFDHFKAAPEFFKQTTSSNSLSSMNQIEQKAKKQSFLGIKGGGFGSGIFASNFDHDDVIDDVYHSTNVAYDESLDDEQTLIKKEKVEEKLEKRKRITKISRGGKVGVDGKPPLPNFHFQNVKEVVEEIFDCVVPKEWVCNPPIELMEGQLPGQNSFNPESRREMLGEEKLDGPQLSVFSMLSRKAQERLKGIIDKTTGVIPIVEEREKKQPTENLSKDLAASALKGYIPFETDISKQLRYKNYLAVNAELETEYITPPSHFSQTEIQHERIEFLKAGQMFRPLSTFMASKFTSAPSTNLEDPLVKKEFKATRTEKEFIPSRLLLKRFNIANPFPDRAEVGPGSSAGPSAGEKLDLVEVLNKETMMKMFRERDRIWSENNKTNANDDEMETIEMLGMDSTTAPPEDTTDVPERPSIDIYKAIFANDSSDDESDSDNEELKVDNSKNSPSKIPESIPTILTPSNPPLKHSSFTPMLPPVEKPVPGEVKTTEEVVASGFRPVFRARSERKDKKKEKRSRKSAISFGEESEEESFDDVVVKKRKVVDEESKKEIPTEAIKEGLEVVKTGKNNRPSAADFF